MRLVVSVALAALAACGSGGGGGTLPPDAGPIDAPVFDASLGIDCKTVFCPLPEMCCAEQIVPPQFSQFCLEPGEEQICMGNRYFCDGPEDCDNGDVCCTNGIDGEVSCTDLASCQQRGFVVCHITSHCPFPQTCLQTPLRIIQACQ